RQVHLGYTDRQGERELRVNPRKSWYRNLEEVSINGDYEVTFHLNRLSHAARFRVFPDLSMSRPAAGHAPASDRHRPVQVRRVQAERIHQSDAKPGLLEGGSTLSRRHRIYDHPQPIDSYISVCCWEV